MKNTRAFIFTAIVFSFWGIRMSVCAQSSKIEWLHNLIKLDSLQGNFAAAYSDCKIYHLSVDSLYNEENKKKDIASQITYEYEKKMVADSVTNARKRESNKEKINAQNAQLEKEATFRYVLFGGLFMVLVLSGFLFNRFRVTRNQSKLIEQQKGMVEEKQKEILDSIHYAKRIQRSLLPTEKYIQKSLERLNRF